MAEARHVLCALHLPSYYEITVNICLKAVCVYRDVIFYLEKFDLLYQDGGFPIIAQDYHRGIHRFGRRVLDNECPSIRPSFDQQQAEQHFSNLLSHPLDFHSPGMDAKLPTPLHSHVHCPIH